MDKRTWNLLAAVQFFLAGAIAALSGYNLIGALLSLFGISSLLLSALGLPTLEALEVIVGAVGGLVAAYTFSRERRVH